MNRSQSKSQLQQRIEPNAFVTSFSEAQSSLWPFYRANLWARLGLLVAVAFVLGACSGSSTNDLAGTVWEVVSLSGSDLLPGTTITLEFTDEEVSGSAGCNHYGGSYQISGSNLTFSEIFQTEMACPEPPGVLEQEGNYLAALNIADSFQVIGNRLELRTEEGGQLLLSLKPGANSTSQSDEPLEQTTGSVTGVIQHATPIVEPTPTTEVTEGTMSQTVEQPLDIEPSVDTTEWVTLVSGSFPISLNYPADWQYKTNADNSQLNLPYVRGFSEPNETLVSQDGCAIHIGFGGISGPTQTLTNDLVIIDGREFTKRTWYEDEVPIFITFLPLEIIPDFELLFAWVSKSNASGCIQNIDAIMESIEFTGSAGGG